MGGTIGSSIAPGKSLSYRERAIGFCSQVFGRKFDSVKGLPVPYGRIETGGSRGGLLKRPAKTPPMQCGTNAFVCSLEVEDFDETAKIIEQLDGVVAFPINLFKAVDFRFAVTRVGPP